MCIAADAMDKDPAALAKADREWRHKRAESGSPVYAGPGVDFTKDTMDSSGNIANCPPIELDCSGLTRQREPLTNLGRISTEKQ